MTRKARHRRTDASRLKSGGDRRQDLLTVATGLLLSVAVLAASAELFASFPREVTGYGRPQSPPPRTVAQKTAEKTNQHAVDPVRLRIPTIGVDAPVDPLTVDKNGVLPPPDSNEGTGWWRDGAKPGERGPAVIVGHVDSHDGPAVFFRLTDLAPGDRIMVDRADGSTAVFVSQRIERHPKDAFPTEAVYGDTPNAQLRLLTCGGQFDRQARRYLDNIVVYATGSAEDGNG